MKRAIIFLSIISFFLSCSEETDLHSLSEHDQFLAVEALITDQADRVQKVILTKSMAYFEKSEVSGVDGATVTVSDGNEEVLFRESDSGTGSYEAPLGFHGEEGKTYHLRIELGDGRMYEADATMPRNGFRIDEIDYAFAGNKTMGLDSLWTLAIWGKDMDSSDYYFVTVGVNDNYYPFEMSVVTDDLYFNGNDVHGFPIATLMQYSQLQKLYGDCCKYLETGDVITLEAMTLKKDYFDFLMSVTLNGAMSAIPLFSPQPANCPTNIRGENVVGYFAACPISTSSVTVDNPLRPYYKRMFTGY